MKSRLRNKQAFTIVEIIVSIVILSLFMLVVMFLYRRSSESFKITAWKQERAAQADLFWAQARKSLEEATNRLWFEPFHDNPILKEEPRPLKFHPTPGSAPDGNILAWNVSKTTYDMASDNHTSEHRNYALAKQGRRLVLTGSGGRPAQLDDVVSLNFIVSSVIKSANNVEEIQTGIDPAAVGTLLEISIVMAPPEGYIASDLRVPMSHKFRLNVAPFPDSAPTY